MCFDQDQQSRSTLGCVLTNINGQDRLLDVFWPWSMVKIDFWICFAQDQWSGSTLDVFICSRSTMYNEFWEFLDPDQRLRSIFGFFFTMINGQDRLFDVFWARSNFWCVSTKINGQDKYFDVFWTRSTINIDIYMCFKQDQRLRSIIWCVLRKFNDQDRMFYVFWERSTVKLNNLKCFE